MTQTKRNRSRAGWLVLILALLTPALNSAAAIYDESIGVQNRRGNPSPSAAASNIDDYTNQDDQVNIFPDTGILKVLRTDQKILINDYVTSAIPIFNVTPREIRGIVRTAVASEGGSAEVIQDKVSKQNFVQVICPRFQLPFVADAVRALDQKWVRALDDGASVTYYTAKFRDVRAIDEIARRYAGEGESNFDLANNSVQRWDEPYRIAEYLHQGAPVADIPINHVLLDVRIYEIDVSNDKKIGLDYIAWKNGPGRNLFELILAGMDNRERFRNVSSVFNPIFPRVINPGPEYLELVREFTADQFSARANYLLTAAYVDFLASKGKAKVLAAAKVLAKSGQGRNADSEPAFFEAVDDVVALVSPIDPNVLTGLGASPRRLRTPSGALVLDPATSLPVEDAFGNPAFTYDGEDVPVDIPLHDRTLELRMAGKTGIFVEIIPHVAMKAVELEIEAGVSSLAGYAPDGLPILSKRLVSTQVVAPDGAPIVLGGLTRRDAIDQSQRMPILGKIPIVGYLAGGETGARRETQVLIVLTPTILAGPTPGRVTEEAQRIMNLATGEGDLDAPRTWFGFDQWLLDRELPIPQP